MRAQDYRLPDLSWLARQGSPLPASFLWGVTTSGFQVEGGFNGTGLPRNHWARWERHGLVVPAGEAVRFWDDWVPLLDLAAGLGINAFRLSLEWARLQRYGPTSLDREALGRYADILAGCRARGMEPVVTLYHFAHPVWLGPDAWLETTSVLAFRVYLELLVPELNRALEERSQDPVRWWITVAQPTVLALGTHLLGLFPHQEPPGAAAFRRALDGLMAAHVEGYRTIHRAYLDRRWPRPMVSFTGYGTTAYALDRGLHDLGVARALGVSPARLPSFLADRRDRFDHTLADLRGPAAGAFDRLVQATLLPYPAEDLPRYLRALAQGEDQAHDFVAVDYHVGPLAHHLRWPLGRAGRDRRRALLAEPWEATVRPEGLRALVRAEAGPHGAVPVLVAENGLATRVRHGRGGARPDGWTRPDFLRAHVAELLEAARTGVPVLGYLHRTLVDGYEWGTYEPRYGIFGVDRQEGVRVLPTDAQGADAAGAYAAIVRSLRTGNGPAALAALRGEGRGAVPPATMRR